MGKSTPKTYALFERLAENSQQWDFNSESQGSSQLKKEIYKVQGYVSLNARLDSLTRKVDALILSQTMKAESQVLHYACNVCASPTHNGMVCPLGNQEGIVSKLMPRSNLGNHPVVHTLKPIILIRRITLTLLGDNHNHNLNLTK